MAKRKRLTPARPTDPHLASTGAGAAPEIKSTFPRRPDPAVAPPIAQIAGDASGIAALQDLVDQVQAARDQGRLVQDLALETVDETYLVRDRMEANDAEFGVLMDSLRARGQQTPIEVVELDKGRFGLISGWRRLCALRRLHAGDAQGGFGTVQALLRRPETAADAYRSMVEENEIRVGLSYYERARIVARATELGVYGDTSAALSGLFGAASRAKRSKIGSFLRLYLALDDRLRFASAIPERLGLALVRALEADPDLTAKLRERLRKIVADSASAEIALLARALPKAQKQSLTVPLDTKIKVPSTPAAGRSLPPDVRVESGSGRFALLGYGVTEALKDDLLAWLHARSQKPV